jgi:hypothetical protein
MDQPAHRITGDQTQRPQNKQYHNNRPQYLLLLRLAQDRQVWVQKCTDTRRFNSLFGLFAGHLVFYAVHAIYVTNIFCDQVDFGGVLGLATQCDHAIISLDIGVNGAG